MIETKKFLTPIEPDLPPPKHTQLLPRCFVCKHFPVCNIREDYLKTAQLIEKVLGAPCESYELYPTPIPVPEFIGTIIEDVEAYFPTTVLSTKDKEGSFYVAKYTDSKNIQFMYIFDKDDKILSLIEYQGEQHYQDIKEWGGKEKFEKVKKYDEIKRQYCKEHNYNLFEIPYTDFDRIDFEYLKQGFYYE